MKKILGVAIAASLLNAVSAHAAIDNGFSQLTGNSEILLAAWDSVAKKSVLVDTGINYDDVISPATYNTTVDVSAALTAAFGSNLSNVRWNVAGLGNLAFGNLVDYPTDYTKNGAILTGAAGLTYQPSLADVSSSYPTGFTDLAARSADVVNGDDVVFGDAAAFAAARAINKFYVAQNDQSGLYVGNSLWGANARYAAWDTSLLGSGSLQAYWLHYTTEDGSAQARSDLGQFTLDLATGKFSYAEEVVSNVPVPAAAWLLVSGLAGLGTVARRRKQA